MEKSKLCVLNWKKSKAVGLCKVSACACGDRSMGDCSNRKQL